MPQIFFNQRYIGGADKLKQLNKEGELEGMIKECLESEESPLELRTPKGSEFAEVSYDTSNSEVPSSTKTVSGLFTLGYFGILLWKQ